MTSKKLKASRFISDVSGGRSNLWRSNIILLVALFSLIFVAPLLDHLSTFVANIALVIVVMSGIFAADYRKHVFNILLAFGFLVLISMAISFFFPDHRALNVIPFLLTVCSLVLSSIALVAHVSRAKTVEKSTVLCAINSYLLMGLTASILFLLVNFVIPSSFSQIAAGPGSLSKFVYYGFVTLSTLGYGDITPAEPLARSLAIFTALGGQLYLVIVMALIIGKFLNSQNQK